MHQAPTEVVNAMGAAAHKRLTTMLTVAISSAAVDPPWPDQDRAHQQAWPRNVRLGVWMPDPRYATAYSRLHPSGCPAMTELSTEARKTHPIGYPHTGLGHLFKEFLGIHDLSDPYLYMTDGGHWEDTGLVGCFAAETSARSSASTRTAARWRPPRRSARSWTWRLWSGVSISNSTSTLCGPARMRLGSGTPNGRSLSASSPGAFMGR